ncbi:hypothetical protein ACN47E_002162 [Coniothyrium glycines]
MGFSFNRIVTCILRIASIGKLNNINLLVAATVFVAAGVLVLIIVHLFWTQRIRRSLHPSIGWLQSVRIIFRGLLLVIFSTLAINITTIVQPFFTRDQRILHIDRSLQLYGATFFAITSTLPIFVVAFSLVFSRNGAHERFGSGTLQTKIIVLLAGTTLVTLGAWYRCATLRQRPVPITQSMPAYFHKACFYIFNFGVEIALVCLYAVMRVDLLFHIPNGAKGPGSYDGTQAPRREGEDEKASESTNELREGALTP